MEIENYEWVDGIYQPKREALQDAIVKLRLDLAQCQRQRDALAEALRVINEWCFTDDGAQALPFEPPWAKQMQTALAMLDE